MSAPRLNVYSSAGQYLQDGRGLDPLAAGLVFTILATAYLGTSLRAPALTLRFGRDLIAIGDSSCRS